jgi:hypothetical protein
MNARRLVEVLWQWAPFAWIMSWAVVADTWEAWQGWALIPAFLGIFVWIALIVWWTRRVVRSS